MSEIRYVCRRTDDCRCAECEVQWLNREVMRLRSALAAAESTSLRYLTERDDWFAAYQRAEEGRRAAERERDEARSSEGWLAFASMREERDAAASDAAFRLELLRAVVATGTKDPRLDARIAEEVGR